MERFVRYGACCSRHAAMMLHGIRGNGTHDHHSGWASPAYIVIAASK